MKNSSKKTNGKKETANVNNENKQVVTLETIAEAYKKETNIKFLADSLGLQYVKAHWTNDGKHIPNSGTRCHLVFNGEDFDDDKLYMLSYGERKPRRQTTPHKFNGLSKVEKLKKELETIEARKKQILEIELPEAEQKEAEQKEVRKQAATNKVKKQAETMLKYLVDSGMAPAQVEAFKKQFNIVEA